MERTGTEELGVVERTANSWLKLGGRGGWGGWGAGGVGGGKGPYMPPLQHERTINLHFF